MIKEYLPPFSILREFSLLLRSASQFHGYRHTILAILFLIVVVIVAAVADSIFTILYSCYYTNLESTWWILRPIFVTLALARDGARTRHFRISAQGGAEQIIIRHFLFLRRPVSEQNFRKSFWWL